MTIDLGRYQSQTRRSTQVGGALVSQQAYSAPFAALADLGDSLKEVGQKIKDQRQRSALAEASRKLSDGELEWTKRLQQRQQEAEDGASGFSESIRAEFAAYSEEVMANAPEYARDFMSQKLHTMGNSLEAKAVVFEGNARLEKQVADLSHVLNNHANIVRSDGEKLETSVADVTAAIQASSLSDAAKKEAVANARNLIVQSHYQGEIQRDPSRALQELNAGGVDAFLKPDIKNRLINSASSAVKRRESEARQEARIAEAERRGEIADLRIEVSAALGALNRGVEYQGIDDLQDRADALDPKLASALRGASEDLSWQKKLLRMSPADMQGEIEATRSAAKAAETPELAATLAARADRGNKVLVAATKALTSDPLGWAQQVGTIEETDLLAGLQAATSEEEQQVVIRERAKAIERTAELFNVPVPFLRPAEVDHLGGVFDDGDVSAKVQALSVLGAVPANELTRVLQKWQADKPDVVAAVGLARSNPHVAELIIRGRDVRKQQPRALPSDADYINDLDASLSVFNARPDVRRQAEEAIKNIIANQSVENGDLSADGTTSAFEQRLEFATHQVLGNVVDWNDVKVLPPNRTMTQERFDARMDALPDEPLGQTISGAPVTGASIRDHGELEAIGQGQYRVRMPSGYVLEASGRPFILDLTATGAN